MITPIHDTSQGTEISEENTNESGQGTELLEEDEQGEKVQGEKAQE